MAKDSSSSDSEDDTDVFKKVADCPFVNDLFRNALSSELKEKPKSKRKKFEEQNETATLNGHEEFLAKRLIKRLDNELEVVNINSKFSEEEVNLTTKGIKLFSDSEDVFDGEERFEDISYPVKPIRNNCSEKEFINRAKESAVSTEWVLSKENCSAWTEPKRPKVINLKVKNRNHNKLECVVLSSTF